MKRYPRKVVHETKPYWRSLRAVLVAVLVVLSVLSFATPAWAADGDLDTTFSGDGWKIQNRTSRNDQARSLAFRSDGAAVVGGWDSNNPASTAALRMVTIAFNASGGGGGPFSTRPRFALPGGSS